MLLPSLFVWLMFLPSNHICCSCCVADVIAKVADGIAYHGGCGGVAFSCFFSCLCTNMGDVCTLK